MIKRLKLISWLFSPEVSSVKYTWICIAHLRTNASNALRSGSHSVTCNQPYLPLLPVAEHHCPLAGTHGAYPRSDGQAELIWTEINFPHQKLNPDTVTHPSTNHCVNFYMISLNTEFRRNLSPLMAYFCDILFQRVSYVLRCRMRRMLFISR